ncbi:phage portal protein [Bosea sp. (in: a-proteobacteria)]|uniref:phage portal protein n=1 Tax=Bosea sp. (in: a-proteobacteria) TaxID=1871050 RepID=UPI001AC73CE4|nr:phage portal protein [Bosea sp. (in: a-proteobacteria)]MBN9436246.1 phage portal protein [Bosea sp. (in: a-proteobacteria)]
MLNFLRSLRGLAAPEQKRSRIGPLIALHEAGRPVWTPRDYGALSREGYQRNPVVHRCVRLIAEAAAQTQLIAKVGGREQAEHPALALIERPNPRQGGIAFRETLYGHLVVAGNAYVEAVSIGREPRELHALRPDRMRVVPGRDGWAEAYDYSVGARTIRFRQDEGSLPPILHLTQFHPVDDHYGLSPIEAAACSLDVHNAAGSWHKALLDNAARPSGALVYDGPEGGTLTEAQFERLKQELEEGFQGARNAGRPLLLEGGLDWKPLSLSPAELDFVAAKGAAAREIALAFGVPPLLLGLPGDNTHANFAEANRAFWRQTLIPLVRRTAQSLAQWLGPAFGDDLSLEPDLDAVEALAEERESLWRRVSAAEFLSTDEKREAVGYGRREEAS